MYLTGSREYAPAKFAVEVPPADIHALVLVHHSSASFAIAVVAESYV